LRAFGAGGVGTCIRLEPHAGLGEVLEGAEEHDANEHEEAQELQRRARRAHGVAQHGNAWLDRKEQGLKNGKNVEAIDTKVQQKGT